MTLLATVDFKTLRVQDTPRPAHVGYAVTSRIDGERRTFAYGQEPACLNWIEQVDGIIELIYD